MHNSFCVTINYEVYNYRSSIIKYTKNIFNVSKIDVWRNFRTLCNFAILTQSQNEKIKQREIKQLKKV